MECTLGGKFFEPELELLTQSNYLIEIGRLITMNIDPDFTLSSRVPHQRNEKKNQSAHPPVPISTPSTYPDSIRQHLPLIIFREWLRILFSLRTPPILFLHQLLTLTVSVPEVVAGIHSSLLVNSRDVLPTSVFGMTGVTRSNELCGSVGMNDFERWIYLHG